MKVKLLSRVRLFATPWTGAYQAPWSMEFSRQEYWSGLPFPSAGDLPNPGIEQDPPTLQADSLSHQESPNYKLILKLDVQMCSISVSESLVDKALNFK